MGVLLIAKRSEVAETPASDNTLVVFAPCGLNDPLNALFSAFRQTHSDASLEVVYDNANVLVNKVRRGELGDVFISPGEIEIGQLASEGYIDKNSIRDWGSLDMVIIASGKAPGVTSIDDLKTPAVKYVSLADPKSNSVGYYGQKALESLGLWEALKGKLVLPGAPLDAIKVVESGEADAGVAYFTCPLDTAPEKASKSALRILVKIPRGNYPPVRLQAGVFQKVKDKGPAEEFIKYMASPEAQERLASNGVVPVEEIR
jgi:molybdate transport system substrate-binding protein